MLTCAKILYSFLSIFIFKSVYGIGVDAGTKTKELPYRGNVLLSGKPLGDKVIKFPYYHSGYDHEDRPIIVLEWGKWDIRSLAEEKSGVEQKKFESSIEYFLELVKSGFFNKKGNHSDSGKVEIVGFIDFDGLDLRQIGTPKSMQLLVQSLAKLEKIYTEVAYAFIVNSNPLVNQVIHSTKPFMGKFLERTDVYGTNPQRWIPQILKKLPRSELHSAYGGTKDFRPVAVYSLV